MDKLLKGNEKEDDLSIKLTESNAFSKRCESNPNLNDMKKDCPNNQNNNNDRNNQKN